MSAWTLAGPTASYTGNHAVDVAAGIALVIIALRGAFSAVKVASSWLGAWAKGETHEWRALRRAPGEIRRLDARLVELKELAQSTNDRAEQLERRGNGHLADVVHAIDTKLDAHHRAIDGRLEKVEAGLDESRRLAGRAATIAARNDEHYAALRRDLDDLGTRIWDHVRQSEDRAAQAEARNYFHEGALRELGVAVDDWWRALDDDGGG